MFSLGGIEVGKMTCKRTTFWVYGIRIECFSQNVKCWQTRSSPSVNMDFMFHGPGYIQINIEDSVFFCYISMPRLIKENILKKKGKQTQTTKDLHRILIYQFDKSLQNSESVKIRGQYSRSTTLCKSLRDEKACILSKVQNARYPGILCSETHRVACMVCFPTNLRLDLHTQQKEKVKKNHPNGGCSWWFPVVESVRKHQLNKSKFSGQLMIIASTFCFREGIALYFGGIPVPLTVEFVKVFFFGGPS